MPLRVRSVGLLLAFSGFSALTYQVLWLRLLGLVFGVTTYAATTVLASFMAGLALGSVLGGRLADRLRRPLLGFAVVELAVGLSALASEPLLDALTSVYVRMAPLFEGNLAALTILRLLTSFPVLLVPTTLMGATFPLAVRAVLNERDPRGDELAALYAANTTGAIAGTLAGAFVLIGRIGVASSFQVAAAINALVALAAWLAARRSRRSPLAAPAAVAAPLRPAPAFSKRTRTAVLIVFALSGFVSLGLEIVWFRVLTLLLPATTYAFAVMLAMVLIGIAAGGALALPLARRTTEPIATLAVLEALTGIAIVGSIYALAASTGLFRAGTGLAGSPATDFAFLPLFSAAALAILPPTILMGAAFPLGLAVWTSGHGAAQGARVGQFYSVNLGAAIIGAPAVGFLALPLLGTRASGLALAWMTTAAAILLLTVLPGRSRRPGLAVGAVLVAAFLWTTRGAPDPVRAMLADRFQGERLFWHEEGIQASTTVTTRTFGPRVMYVNGLHQANDSPEMVAVHQQMGYLPIALHPAPRRALVIGLGGGATAGAVTRDPSLAVDVVELSDTVVRAAAWFAHINFDVLRNPRVRLRVDDGRNHLLLARQQYDVITADIIQPKHAGAGNVYSAEYFRLARAALAEDGLMLQWIGHREANQYALIMRTFLSVFPETTLWANGTLMVGARRPFQIDAARVAARMADPATRPVYEALGATDIDALLGLYTAGPKELARFVGEGPILVDDRPSIEYFLSLPDDEMVDLSGLRGNPADALGPRGGDEVRAR